MDILQARLRLARGVGLLLLLAVSVAGFMLLISILADSVSTAPPDPLAERPTDSDLFQLPGSASLFAIAVAAVAITIAIVILVSITRAQPLSSTYPVMSGGSPLSRRSRMILPLAIGLVLALLLAGAGLYLAFAESSPLLRAGFEQQPGATDRDAASHQIHRNWIAPIGVVILAAFFFSVALIGFLKPRLLFATLGMWLAASLIFGFFTSSSLAGLTLFVPMTSLPVPNVYAGQVAQYRTIELPDEPAPGSGSAQSGDDSALSDSDETDSTTDEVTAEEDIDDGQAGQSADATEDVLIQQLQSSPNPAERAKAAEGLADYQSEDSLDALAKAGLADASLRVREAALNSIKAWSLENLVEILKNHPERTIRQAAAASLGRMNDERAIDPLVVALGSDRAANVRAESAKSLGRLGDVAAFPSLIQALQNDVDIGVRENAARALGQLGDERAVSPLLDALVGDNYADVRESAARALGQLGPPGALPQLIQSRESDTSPNVRAGAKFALSRYSLAELIDILQNDISAEVRAAAAKLLGERRTPSSLPVLLLALSDPAEIVREAAREALGKFGTLTPLENGASVLNMPGGGIGLVPGTTARRGESLPQPETALFVVQGAANTTFLRTSVGEVFDGADWHRQRSDTEFYAELERIDNSELPGAPFSHLDGFDKETLRMTPKGALGQFPIGALPIPLFLETISADGAFELVANTFISYENRRQLETASGIPVYSSRELANAATIDDEALAPPDTTERVRQLAHLITDGYDSPYRKAAAIRDYLTQNYEYGLKGSSEADVPEGQDLVDWFLFESRIGTCGTFSSAFAILARSVGLPARVVSGWLIVPTEDRQVVYADQAHQIAEILFEGYGWVPFEATPGDGPASRAQSNFQGDQFWGSEIQEGLQGLVENLSSDDPEVVRNAQRALERQGTTVIETETGGNVIQKRGEVVAFPPSTTTQQGSGGGSDVAVFSVTGAEYTDYLVTATGDVYQNGGWLQLNPAILDYPSTDSIPEVVLDAIALGGEPWDSLPRSRSNPYLLAPDHGDFDRARMDRIQIAPVTTDGRIPAGVIPISRHLNFVDREGVYAPFSGVFSMNEPARDYQWWSVVPIHSGQELRAADIVPDPTYTRLPANLPARIRHLALEITYEWETPYTKAKALENYLRTQYTYRFADNSTVPLPPGHDPVDWFLFESREGTCGQFSSAFVVLARSIGLPARVAAGWAIQPGDEKQIVYASQAHQWAEVAFEEIGWVTFEPTAPGSARTRLGLPGPDSAVLGGRTLSPQAFATVTDITSWPREIERGRPFIIGGTVRTWGGQNVDDMEVEIFINEIKANGGLKVGTGTVRNGRYEIEITIPPSMDRGNYQLIAHAIENETYYESWSDPDIAVYSQSGLVFSGPQEVNVGTEAVFRGRVTEDTGAGVSGIPLQIVIDGNTMPAQRTGDDGRFSFSNTFLHAGNHWAEVRFSDNDFLRANSARINLEVVIPTVLSLEVEPRALVGSTSVIGGMLVDSRNRPFAGGYVAITVDDGETIWANAGADGRFQAEYTFETSGEFTVEAAFIENRPLLASSASATVGVLNESVLTFEGPTKVLARDKATFFGQVSSSTLEELEPLDIEILDGDGTSILTITTEPDGAFSYESPPITETGSRALTARLAEQHSLTASAASAAFSVVHGTVLAVDGPAVGMVGEEIVMTGSLRRRDGQPIADAPVHIGTEAVLTSDDGTFSYALPLPSSIGGSAVEEQIRIPYVYAGTEHLASTEGSHSITIGWPLLTAERPRPVARGDVAEIRGAAFIGMRPMQGAVVSLLPDLEDTTGLTGEFLINYAVPPDAPLGPRTLTMSLDGLNVSIPVTLDVRSSTHVVATPLDDIRPGRTTMIQAALYNDSGVGIPNAPLRTSTGLNLTTDESGVALFEIAVSDSENLRAFPVTFTYSGNDANMPLNYFLALPVTPASFSWLLFVGLPFLLLVLAGLAFSAYRLRLAGVPFTVLDPRRPLPPWSTQVVTVRAPVLREQDTEDEEQPPEPIETAITIKFGGPAAETPGVYGISEEIVIFGRLSDEDDDPVTGMPIQLSIVDHEPVELKTDSDGEFHHLYVANEFGEFTLSAGFPGTPDYVWSEAYASFRIVDFREEMVRLFGEFVDWASRLEPQISGQSPREIEAIIIAAGTPVDQRALDEVITRFEEADYSEHDIARRHYEAMYKAWRIVVGD